MEIKNFKVAAKDLKENKGIDPASAEAKAKRLLDSRIAQLEEELVLAELEVEKLNHEAKVDEFALKAAQIRVDSAKRSAENAKVERLEKAKEAFDAVWGRAEADAMQTAFRLRQEIYKIEAENVAETSEVVAATAQLNELTQFPGVKVATRTVNSIKAALEAVKRFKEEAFGTETTEATA